MKKLAPFLAFVVCPYVYVDLGQTLVDTSTNNYNPMFYMKVGATSADHDRFPTAKEYVDAVVATGSPLGMIADVPEAWGSAGAPPLEPVNDYMTAKLLRTQEFLLGLHPEDQTSFEGAAFDWSPFAGFEGAGADRMMTGRVFLPRTNAERKRSGSTAMFDRGKALAAEAGCDALYLGEDEGEMALADRAGMISFWVGHTSTTFFLAPERLGDFIGYSRKPRDPAQGPYWRGPY